MKIAFFYNLTTGGAKRYVKQQIDFLRKDHLIDVFTINYEKDIFDVSDLVNKIYSYSFGFNSFLPKSLKRLRSDFEQFTVLKNLHKRIALNIDMNNYDLVIVHPDHFTQAPYLLRFLKTKNIYYCQEWLRIAYEDQFAFNEDVNYLKKIYESINRRIRKKIDFINTQAAKIIFANSNFTASNIKMAYKKKSIVCYPGVNIDTFKPQNIKKIIDILFIGQKINLEGYNLLEKVLMLYFKNIKLKIIDKKNEKEWMTDQELANEYNKAKVVVCLTLNEPFGFIPLEAMSCGVPVIAANSGGYRETVLNNKTGYLINFSVNDLYQALKNILSNENLATNFGRNGREWIEKKWSIKKTNAYFNSLIEYV